MPTLQRLPATAPIPDRRRVARITTDQPQRDRPAGPLPTLVDISPFGCQIECTAIGTCRPWRFIEIDFGNDMVARAIVRWSDDNRFGAEFTRPLTTDDVDDVLGSAEPLTIREL